MTNRKVYIIHDPFATYFVTFTVVGWVDLFTRKECKDIMIDSFKYCINNKGLVIHAYVIMDSHIHMIVTAKEGSDGLSAIIRDMKKHTSKQLLNWILKSGRESRKDWLEIVLKYHAKYNKNNDVYQVWQQNNQPKVCKHPKFTIQKLNYIHYNPVKAGIVEKSKDYLYSSARNYMGIGECPLEVNLIEFGAQEGYIFM